MTPSRASRREPGGASAAAVLDDLSRWARKELYGDILPFWLTHARDRAGEGFLGEIAADGSPVPSADRSVVCVARHLWTFSAAAAFIDSDRSAEGAYPGMPSSIQLRETADAAYDYLISRFHDDLHGGFYWAVSPGGAPSVEKKQIYGQAFALYALSEYAGGGADDPRRAAEAKAAALETFALLEDWARDDAYGGYAEALSRDWSPAADRTLSPVDLDCDKSMNTNLHVLEALSALYRLEPVRGLRVALVSCLGAMARSVYLGDGHLGLFFRRDWSRMDRKISFGHDVEASWLMDEALTLLTADGNGGNKDVDGIEAAEAAIFADARSAIAGLAGASLREGHSASDGGLDDEADPGERGGEPRRAGNRIWWCQAEALVGFLGAWERTGDAAYLAAAERTRGFIESNILDREFGEWRWGVDSSGVPLPGQPKGGNWKTGYHNGRACMEVIRRCAELRSMK